MLNIIHVEIDCEMTIGPHIEINVDVDMEGGECFRNDYQLCICCCKCLYIVLMIFKLQNIFKENFPSGMFECKINSLAQILNKVCDFSSLQDPSFGM